MILPRWMIPLRSTTTRPQAISSVRNPRSSERITGKPEIMVFVGDVDDLDNISHFPTGSEGVPVPMNLKSFGLGQMFTASTTFVWPGSI